MGIFGQEKSHESFGLIGIHHIGSRDEVLFGSSIKHSQIIRISIHNAEMERSLSEDRYYPSSSIVEVDLSYSQFAEFVTTHNMGTGIPCTIRRQGGKAMEDPPFESKRDQHRQEFKETADKIASRMDDLYRKVADLHAKPSVTKAERAELLEMVRFTRQMLASDMPFAVDQFNRQVDQSVKEAKGEIEGFALRRVVLAGMDALTEERARPPALMLGSESDEQPSKP